jgi:hypothetical protein
MAKNEELTKHTLHLRAGDMDRLKALFPDIGASLVIRKLVINFLDRDADAGRKVEFSSKEFDL